MTKAFRLIQFVLFLLLLSTGCNNAPKENSSNIYTVTKVVDGDTFYMDNGEKVRFIGIDAPESRNAFKKVKGYFGKESKAFLVKYLTGRKVKLEFDIGRKDQYKRTLAYVFLEDGTFVNAEIVKQGYAVIYTVPPNVKYADLFLKMQEDARNNNRGLWNAQNDTVPFNDKE